MSARAQVDNYEVVVLEADVLVDVGAIPHEATILFTTRGAFSAYLALKEVFKDHPDA